MDKELQLQAILESSTLEYQTTRIWWDELLQKGIDASLLHWISDKAVVATYLEDW